MLKHNRIGVFAILLTFVAYLISPAKTLHSNAPQMVVFDSGQGLSVLFEHLGDVWLYDLGPAFESYSVSERVVMPFLRGHDLKDRVQGLVLSHGDADHVGRAEWFVQKALPRYKISGEPDRVPDGFNDCEPGRVFKVGDANLEILYSANSGITDVRSRGLNSNSRSCVIRFRYKQYNVLLMGDLEGRAEMDFVKLLGEGIESNILILGHHGSANASSYALLKRVNPELAIASAGFDNRFGHPSHKVLARLRNLNIKTLNTATSGALTIRFAEEQIQIVEERKNNPAFWMWPGG